MKIIEVLLDRTEDEAKGPKNGNKYLETSAE